MNTYEIRKATEEETQTVIALLKEVAAWLQNKDINQWGFLLEGGEDDEIQQAIKNSATYVACQNGEILATFTLYAQQSEWDQHIWGQEDRLEVLYLHRLAVRPQFMKNGIGKEILNWIDENLYKTIRLDCVAHNPKLCAYYEESGFILSGTTVDGHCKFQKVHWEGNGKENEANNYWFTKQRTLRKASRNQTIDRRNNKRPSVCSSRKRHSFLYS